MNRPTQFMGFRREDGRVGVRNYVAIVSTVFCGSSVTRRIAEATGTMAFTHDGGCGQLGPEKEHYLRVLKGVITHPNVGAVLVVGLGCEQFDAEALAKAAGGKTSNHIKIHEEGGNTRAVKRGVEIAGKMMKEVAKAEREPVGAEELVIATQCGSSDTGSGLASNPALGVMADKLVELGGAVILGETGSLYGAAGLMAKRAISKEVGDRIIKITDVLESHYRRMGRSLREAQPTPGNIAGGLTTIVEKSLGGVRKGGTTPIKGVLKPGERIGGKGLWVMNTSLGIGACSTSDMLASGAQIMVFTTGKGNPVGSPLAPVIKVTATRETIESLNDIIDFDASPVLYGDETLESCGKRLFKEVLEVAGGKLVQAEKTGHNVFAIGKVIV